MCASCDAGLALCGKAGLANTCTCPGSAGLLGLLARTRAFIGASCDAGFTLVGNACQANTGTCAGSAAATGASCTSDDDFVVQVATRASYGMAMHDRPTLAPALVAPRLLGLLAHPMVIVFGQVATQASH